MDKHIEQERLQLQCLRLSKYTALLREANTGPEQRVFQCLQNLALVDFLSAMQKNAFRLLDVSEEARELGAETLERIYAFLEEYAGLMEQEYSYHKNNPSEL